MESFVNIKSWFPTVKLRANQHSMSVSVPRTVVSGSITNPLTTVRGTDCDA